MTEDLLLIRSSLPESNEVSAYYMSKAYSFQSNNLYDRSQAVNSVIVFLLLAS